jgi:hypothetical protein
MFNEYIPNNFTFTKMEQLVENDQNTTINQNIEDEPVIIEFDHDFDQQLKNDIYHLIGYREDHCVNPEMCEICRRLDHCNAITNALTECIETYTSDNVSQNIQMIFYIIYTINRFSFFYKDYPKFLIILDDKINEFNNYYDQISDNWYSTYISQNITNFYRLFTPYIRND